MIAALLFLSITLMPVHSRVLHAGLLLVHLFGLGYTAARLLPRQPLSAMFIAFYLLLYLFNPLLIALGVIPLEIGVEESTYYTANGLILIGIDLFAIAAIYLRRTPYDLIDIPPMRLPAAPVEFFILGTIGTVAVSIFALVFVMRAAGIDVFTVHKSFRATDESIWFLLVTYSAMALPLAVFFIGLKSWRAQIPYLLSIGVILLIHFVIFRIRTLPISVSVGYLVAVFARSYAVSLGGRPVWGVISRGFRRAVIVGAPLLLVIGISIKYVRASYQMGDYEVTRERVERLINHTFSGGDLGHSIFLRLAIETFPEQHEYLKGQSYYRILFIPIPRSLWSDKPYTTSKMFAGVVDPALTARGTTIPPGIVGDLYINFGLLGVVGMFVFGAVFAQERYKGLPHVLALAGVGYWLFKFTRGAFTNPLITVTVIWGVAVLTSRFIRPIYVGNELDEPEPINESESL